MMENVKVICLTGGPCGGKTSCLSILSDLFQSLGWKVFRVPETATILLRYTSKQLIDSGGVHFAELNDEMAYLFQKDLLKTMLQIEDTYIHLAQKWVMNGQKAVVICDRGAMDPSAYIPRENWLQMIKEIGVEESDLRDHRYDCVVHLVSAAKGAEAFYSSGSNSVRSEGIQLASELDSLVMNAWIGHASLQVVDNISVANFAEKCDRVVQAVLTRLGFVADHHRYGKMVRKHKFVVKDFKMEADFPVPYRDFIVDHFYLVNTSNDGMQIRIRKRQQVGSGSTHLNMTIRHSEQNGQRVETRRNLSFREFEALKAQADPTRVQIKKYRRCFLYKDRYYQMDVYQEPFKELILLEGYLDYDHHSQSHNEKISNPEVIRGLLPEWLNLTEVTNDKNYSMFSIASRSGPFVDKIKLVLN